MAKRKTLGNSGIMFCGDESKANAIYNGRFIHNTIYFKLELKNNKDEDIMFFTDSVNNDYINVTKDATNINVEIEMGATKANLSAEYSIGENEVWLFYDVSNQWNLKVGSNTDLVSMVVSQTERDEVTISPSNDFNGVLYQLLASDSVITLADTENDVESVITTPQINFKDFTSRYSFNQEGSLLLTTDTITNCLTWGSLGNVVFAFETLVPVDNVNYRDEGQPRQMFGMIIRALLSKDIIFGNSTEYFIRDNVGETDSDYTQIYPIDRSHTYGANADTEQYINDYFGKSIVESNAKDITQTFFFRASNRLQQLMKHTTKNDREQNKTFKLKVQYPFHSETYEVIIESGGTNPNINELQTLTVTYKQKDDAITI